MFWKKKESPPDKEKMQLEKGDMILTFDLDSKTAFKLVRKCTPEQKEQLDVSSLCFVTGRSVFMHYSDDDPVEKRGDPEWENRSIFFWDINETFPKKSLPPYFEQFLVRIFQFPNIELGNVHLICGETAPWFGQPGGGYKYYCEENGEKLTIEELRQRQLVEYLEFVELNSTNLEILREREHYFFLASKTLDFIDGLPAINGKVIPISAAYEIGLFTIVRRL